MHPHASNTHLPAAISLRHLLFQEHGSRFGFSVSHTTRGPRPGEENGVHYHFSPKEAVEADIARGFFLEHAAVHGNLYGTSLSAVADVSRTGKVAVLDIDVQVGGRTDASRAGPAGSVLSEYDRIPY